MPILTGGVVVGVVVGVGGGGGRDVTSPFGPTVRRDQLWCVVLLACGVGRATLLHPLPQTHPFFFMTRACVRV